ncbi:MAG: DUF6152 family protein [Pseudomonadota bacterium]
MNRATALSLLAFCSTAVFAHHGNSEYDLGTTVQYQGTVVDFLWRNPHILAKVATHTPDGEAITLEIEGASPSVLRTGGFSSASLTIGEQVTAVVSPSRRSPKESAYGYEIVKADGSTVPLVSARLKAQLTNQTTTDIVGTWVATAASFGQFTRSLGSWPLNEKASAIRSKFTLADSGQVKCLPVSAPMLTMYPVVMVLERSSDHVDIKSEWLGAQRIVYTDGRMHPALDERFPQGHSIGHWEGAELVVDTTNFTDQETGGIPSGGQRHLTERFTLGEDGKSMRYSYVLQDAEFLAGEVTGGAELNYRPDLQLASVECDQELAKRFLR